MSILLYRINMDRALSNVSEEEIQKHHQAIGSYVKYLREKRGISQLDMALSIGIKSIAFYSNCENSKNGKHFNVEHLFKICKILSVPLGDFFQHIELYSLDSSSE